MFYYLIIIIFLNVSYFKMFGLNLNKNIYKWNYIIQMQIYIYAEDDSGVNYIDVCKTMNLPHPETFSLFIIHNTNDGWKPWTSAMYYTILRSYFCWLYSAQVTLIDIHLYNGNYAHMKECFFLKNVQYI